MKWPPCGEKYRKSHIIFVFWNKAYGFQKSRTLEGDVILWFGRQNNEAGQAQGEPSVSACQGPTSEFSEGGRWSVQNLRQVTNEFGHLWKNAAYYSKTWKNIGVFLISGIKYSNCHYNSSIIKASLWNILQLGVLFFKVLPRFSGLSIALQPKITIKVPPAISV